MKSVSHRIIGLLISTQFVWIAGCSRSLNETNSFDQLPPAGVVESPPVAVAEPTLVVGEVHDDNPDVRGDLSEKVAAANVAFAFDLYKAVCDRDENLVFSPHSLSTALAMAYAGARGDTELQIKETLHFDVSQTELHPIIKKLNLELNDPGDRQSDGFKLRVANSVWAQQGYTFLPSFLATLTNNYGEGIRLVDFIQTPGRELARKQINQWTNQATSGRISELLSKGILTEDTRLALVNAVYFNGLWKSPFASYKTRERLFTPLVGDHYSVPTMEKRFEARTAMTPNYQAIEIPYRGTQVQMLVVVPTAGKFSEFEQSLTSESFDRIRKSLSMRDCILQLPKFQYDSELELAPILESMGMPLAFTPNQADFSGMDGSRKLFLRHVIHKAIVKVDERGTEAAAASAAIAEIISMPPMIQVNRPFVYCIYDAQRGNLLFLGRVLDPR